METLAALACAVVAVLAMGQGTAPAGGLDVTDSGGAAEKRLITVVSPGVYKAVVSQGTGGGISEFYDLQADPEAKVNLACVDRGLLEIGWHAQQPKDKPKGAGDDADWPSAQKRQLKAMGELEVAEKSPARVRIKSTAPFTWWAKKVFEGFDVKCAYTFYPTGRIVSQVSVENRMEETFYFSYEHGPHLMVKSVVTQDKRGEPMGFASLKGEVKSYTPSEELVIAYPTAATMKSAILITIPPEQQKRFNAHMRHGPAGSIGWDRAGYGIKGGIAMAKGYTETWACMIQLGSKGAAVGFQEPKEGLPYALDYRTPATISGAELVKDEPGDFNGDGFNESEGCYVLKRGNGALEFTFEGAKGAANFSPVFKIKAGAQMQRPKEISIDGKKVPVVSGTEKEGTILILQVIGSLPEGKVKVVVE